MVVDVDVKHQSRGALEQRPVSRNKPRTPDALKVFPATSPDVNMSNARTAALGRYLTALDSPPLPKDASVTTAPAELANPANETNEFETNFSNSDLYNGHSVVAMPSLGGKSVREVVSSRDSSVSRPRSRSAGRAPRSRDIVQEAYDRMGVSRDEMGRGETEMSNERYRAAPTVPANAQQQQQQRGRMLESNTDGQRRARSLSRGRNVSNRWPPTRSQAAASAAAASQGESAPQRPAVITKPDLRIDTSVRQTNYPQQQVTPTAVTPTEESRINRASSFPERGATTPAWKMKATSNPPPPHSPPPEPQSTGEEPEEAAGAGSPDTAKALSVKERITSLTGNKTNRKFAKRPVPVQYVKRDHPPLIDIYQDVRKQDETDTGLGTAPEPSSIPPSPAAAAAADAAAELVRKNQYGRSSAVRSPSARSTPNNMSSHFAGQGLGSPIRSHSKPPTEIAGADASGGVADATSVALSSVSADDYETRSPLKDYHKREVVSRRWTPGNNNSAPKSTNAVRGHSMQSPNAPRSSSSSQSLTVEQMERIIGERVNTQVSELESRMENQMLRLENRMEDRMQQRMDVLESKMDKIGAMLSVIVSNRQEM